MWQNTSIHVYRHNLSTTVIVPSVIPLIVVKNNSCSTIKVLLRLCVTEKLCNSLSFFFCPPLYGTDQQIFFGCFIDFEIKNFFSLGRLINVYISNVIEVVLWDLCDPWYVMCFSLFKVTSIYSISNSTRKRDSKTRWKVDIEDSTVKSSKNREIELISKKWEEKSKQCCSKDEINWYTMWK